MAQGGNAGPDLRDTIGEATVVHERDEIRIVEEMLEFALDVAVVDVDRDGPDLERREHSFEVLGAVEEIQPM